MYNELLENLERYIQKWEAEQEKLQKFPCTIPFIGLFFELHILNNMHKITKEYESYLKTL